jgi:hypothetical protein
MSYLLVRLKQNIHVFHVTGPHDADKLRADLKNVIQEKKKKKKAGDFIRTMSKTQARPQLLLCRPLERIRYHLY